MSRQKHDRPITRRTAIQRMAAGTAGVVGISSPAFAARPSPAAGAIRLERQSTGAEIWQITTERLNQSNIYCEVPYCSKDSRYFVYIRRNPKLPGKNNTELMVVELGTWKQHRLDVATGILGLAISHDGVLYYLKEAAGGSRDLFRADLVEGTPQKIHRIESKWLGESCAGVLNFSVSA